MAAILRQLTSKKTHAALACGVALFAMSAYALSPVAPAENYCASSKARANYVPIAKRLAMEKSVFFQVDNCRSPSNYLLGTMHSDAPKITQLATQTAPYYRNADIAIFELDARKTSSQEVMKYMFLPSSGKTLVQMVGRQSYADFMKIVQADKPQIPINILPMYRPWAASILLQFPEPQADGVVLDDLLQKQALAAGVEVKGLETIAQQFKPFTGLSQSNQVFMFRDAVKRYGETKRDSATLARYYGNYNLLGMANLADRSIRDISNSQVRNMLQKQLIEKRNVNMLKNMRRELKTGNAFVAVGALHLTGHKGLLAMLEKRGFFITPMPLKASSSVSPPSSPNTSND